MVCEDFGIDVNMVNIELSYLPSDLINSINSPPVIITSDRQVRNFLTYVKNKASTQLCVSTQAPNIAEEGTESPNREEEPMESDDSVEAVGRKRAANVAQTAEIDLTPAKTPNIDILCVP
ncbi:hypothetical protein F2Q70_00000931 [Brassica cretica]|uniref:Uncharacterized protein n=1 Tax=Brassica cretica TaxID=69181 RepID=A0A8S9IXB7_BRACR|nr:hypothetical protein F2Q70_00000931 [Brassica cretica]